MRFFFYNSFTLGSGYKYAELKDNAICSTNIPVDIDCDFSNGGCQLVVRETLNHTSILVIKGILYVNNKKRFDEQGRKVYINFAVEATANEHRQLNNIFYAAIAEWQNLCRYLGDSVQIPSSGEYGYNVSQSNIESLVKYLSSYNIDIILKRLNINKNNLNSIVLKSSNYEYYKALADDLYKCKNTQFYSNFVKENIITGELFTKYISEKSENDYDDFVLKVKAEAEQIKDVDLSKEEGVVEALQSEVEKEQTMVSGTNVSSDVKSNEDLMDVVNKRVRKEDLYILNKVYTLLRPHLKLICSFAIGMLVGYLIWK